MGTSDDRPPKALIPLFAGVGLALGAGVGVLFHAIAPFAGAGVAVGAGVGALLQKRRAAAAKR
jgi:hypothetical protein